MSAEPASKDKASKPAPRPLSPHLFIYKPQLTSVLSITHRACGVALAIGTILVTWLLLAAAMGPDAFKVPHDLVKSPVGTVLVFGWSVALYYHMCNGIRHLFWDSVHLFKIENAYRAGYVVLLMTVVLTALTWWKVLTT